MTLIAENQPESANPTADAEQMDVGKSGSSLEEAANERKQRLKRMREQMQQGENTDREEVSPSSKTLRPVFRSYEPQSDIGIKRDDMDLFAVEKEIADQLADTEDTAAVEQVDITTLAPRKVDWDLKRDVAEKMEKLERRTQRAIAQLIRDRLKAGKAELADAVSSGAYSELQTDED